MCREEVRKSEKPDKKEDRRIVQAAPAQSDVTLRTVKQLASQSASLVLARRTAGLDNSPSYSYIPVSTPAGPLSQDTLSLGGSFIDGIPGRIPGFLPACAGTADRKEQPEIGLVSLQ